MIVARLVKYNSVVYELTVVCVKPVACEAAMDNWLVHIN